VVLGTLPYSVADFVVVLVVLILSTLSRNIRVLLERRIKQTVSVLTCYSVSVPIIAHIRRLHLNGKIKFNIYTST